MRLWTGTRRPLRAGPASALAALILLVAAIGERPARAADPDPRAGRVLAFLVGVGTYDPRTGLDDLPYTPSDIARLYELLRSAGVPEDNIQILVDDKATMDALAIRRPIPFELPTAAVIRHRMDAFTRQLKAADSAIYCFSGHGLRRDGKGFFCPSGAKLETDETLVSLEGDDASVRAMIGNSLATRRFFLFDMCRTERPKLLSQAPSRYSRPWVDFETLSGKKPSGAGLVGLHSCATTELSYQEGPGQFDPPEDRRGSSIFMHYLLEGWSGQADRNEIGNRDGFVSIEELQTFVSRRVPPYVLRKKDRSQNPQSYRDWNGPEWILPRAGDSRTNLVAEIEAAAAEERWADVERLVGEGATLGVRVSELSIGVRRGLAPPTITQLRPPQGSLVEDGHVALEGVLATGRRTDVVMVDGQRVPVDAAGHWAVNFDLAKEGTRSFRIVVADGGRRRAEYVWPVEFRRAQARLSVELTTPAPYVVGQKVSIRATVASGMARAGDQLTLAGVSSGTFDFSTGELELEFLLPQPGALALAVRWTRGETTLASARVPIEVAAGHIGLDRLSALARTLHRMSAIVNERRASAYVGERLVAERKWNVYRSTDAFGLDADVRVVHVFRTETYNLLAYFSGGTTEGFVSQIREAMTELSEKGEDLGPDAIKVTDGPPDPEAIGTFVAHWRIGFPEGQGVEMLVTLVRVHANYEVRVSLSPAG